ncbi:MAG: hypothetical protein HY351_00555, partial [Candidatus Omnitrophica bacterium]|nr:hypothetical protein [Candidatus Omnitrophota bacterium]
MDRKAVQSAEAFYKNAQERDLKLFGNIKRILETERIKSAFLVAGGFHSPGMTAEFRKRKIPFVSITPQISDQTIYDRYFARIAGKRATVEEFRTAHPLSASTASYAAPSAMLNAAERTVIAESFEMAKQNTIIKTPRLSSSEAQRAELPSARAELRTVRPPNRVDSEAELPPASVKPGTVEPPADESRRAELPSAIPPMTALASKPAASMSELRQVNSVEDSDRLLPILSPQPGEFWEVYAHQPKPGWHEFYVLQTIPGRKIFRKWVGGIIYQYVWPNNAEVYDGAKAKYHSFMIPSADQSVGPSGLMTDPKNRRRGVTTLLLDVSLHYLKDKGIHKISFIDASFEGSRLFKALGFEQSSWFREVALNKTFFVLLNPSWLDHWLGRSTTPLPKSPYRFQEATLLHRADFYDENRKLLLSLDSTDEPEGKSSHRAEARNIGNISGPVNETSKDIRAALHIVSDDLPSAYQDQYIEVVNRLTMMSHAHLRDENWHKDEDWLMAKKRLLEEHAEAVKGIDDDAINARLFQIEVFTKYRAAMLEAERGFHYFSQPEHFNQDKVNWYQAKQTLLMRYNDGVSFIVFQPLRGPKSILVDYIDFVLQRIESETEQEAQKIHAKEKESHRAEIRIKEVGPMLQSVRRRLNYIETLLSAVYFDLTPSQQALEQEEDKQVDLFYHASRVVLENSERDNWVNLLNNITDRFYGPLFQGIQNIREALSQPIAELANTETLSQEK